MDIKEIKQIVDLMKRSALSEFSVEEENFKLTIKRSTGENPQPQIVAYSPPPAAVAAAPVPAAAPVAATPVDDGKYITSPMVGTFYAAPAPETPAFTEVGKSVSEDSVICIIEAMKIMNEIQAEQKGVIEEILVTDGQPVEFGQRLYKLK